MIKKVIRIALIQTLFLILMGSQAFAQTTSGEIYGTITDANNDALPGVVVTLVGDKMQSQRTVTSNTDGTFRFLLIPKGDYTITYIMPGFQTIKTDNVSVRTGEKTRQNQVMETSSVQELLTVVAESPLIDSSTTDSRFEFDTEELSKIPTLARSIDDIVKFTPGVTGVRMDAVNGDEGGMPNIRGAGQEGNQYVIDGLSSRGSMNFDNIVPQNFDSIESLQVISDPFSPEYGKTMGGAINVVTKSGGNDFFGEVGYQFRNDSLEADREPVQTANTTTGLDRSKLWSNLGGYIVKDKLWFFVSYNRDEPTDNSAGATPRTIDASNLVNLDGSPYGSDYTVYNYVDGADKTTNDQLFYKFTYNISQNQNIALSGSNVQNDQSITTGHQDRWQARETTGSRYRLNYSLLVGSIGSFELKYGVQKNELDAGGLTDRGIAQRTISTIAWNYGNRSRFDNQVEERSDLAAKFVGFLDTANFGSHEMSVGFELEEFKTDWTRGTTGGSEDIFDDNFNDGLDFIFDYATNDNDQIVMDATGNPILIPNLLTERRHSYNNNKVKGNGFFLQDRITFDKWTIMAGVRADTSDVYDDSGSPVWKWGYGDFLSPRFSLIYDVFNDQKHIIKGAYGVFKDTSTTRIAEFFNRNGGNAFRTYYWSGGENPSESELHNPDNWVFNREQSAESNPINFAPGMKPNENLRWLLEYNYRWAPKHAMTLRYTTVESKDLIEDVVVMIDGEDNWFLDNFEEKRRDYKSVDFILTGSVTGRFDYSFSYTWSDSQGTNPGNFENESFNIPGGSGSYVGVFGDSVLSDGSAYGDALAEILDGLGGRGVGDQGWYGKLSDSVDNAVNFTGNFHLPWALDLSTAFQFVDGFFYAKKGFQPGYGAYFTFPEGRGSRQTPATYWLDLSLARTVRVGNRHDITFRLDAFNAFNKQEAISMVEEDTIDFEEIFARQEPQAFQLGIQYKF